MCKYCAESIASAIADEPGEPFRYFDKGIMALIGRNAAVAEVGKHRHELSGPIAFAAWLGVHALLLVPTRAKIGQMEGARFPDECETSRPSYRVQKARN
jgi:NADH:ubiquinone reductase (H+-translocating)